MSQLNLEIIRKARVEISPVFIESGIALKIIIENRYVHIFSPQSKESLALKSTDLKMLESLYNNGFYIIADEKLVDYRLSSYQGFIQTDSAMAKLQEVIGIEKLSKNNSSVKGLFSQHKTSGKSGIYLGGEWDNFELDVKELGDGGLFKNNLLYKYSPFSANIITSLEVERLICTNGMVASSPFITFEVPVINDWEKNLHVVSAQLKPKINDILSQRMASMADQRASVATIMKIEALLDERDASTLLTDIERQRLESMANISNSMLNLGKYYHSDVFKDAKKASFLDSHLTQFDAFNILTEASTHLGRNEENDTKIQRELNSLVFDEFKNKKKIKPAIPQSHDSDFRRAFFGES